MKRAALIIALGLQLIRLNAQSKIQEEWDDFFMPGVGYNVYIPKNSAELGIYQGVVAEFVIYARAKSYYSTLSGPSRMKFYGNVGIMKSDQRELGKAKDLMMAKLGVNLSLEGNTTRNYLIPYFGLEMGGLFQRDFSTLQFTPLVGVQLYSGRRIIWSTQAGYMYTTSKFDEYSGYSMGTTLNVLLWND